MSMVKIFSPSGWDFDCPVASLLKIPGSGRLTGSDRREFIKRASGSESIFLPLLDSVKFAADQEPVHLIAVGASEFYGPNRNGDGFKRAQCERFHKTFEKYAHWFRNHKNKPAEGHPYYGDVKAAAYNPVMHRIELLTGLYKTKAAADRAGGLVADKELEKLARGEDIPVSMACRVPYDVCSGCGNKARTRDEYCKEANCKYGGCDKNLTRLIKTGSDVHVLHVENESPMFFDISNVWRPADRIAYAGKADWLTKAAGDSFDGCYGADGATLAHDLGITAPLQVALAQLDHLDPYHANQVKIAHGLASLEREIFFALPEQYALGFVGRPRIDLDQAGLTDRHRTKVAGALAALADRLIILPLEDFARMTQRAELAEKAAAEQYRIYTRLVANGDVERAVAANPYNLDTAVPTTQHKTAAVKLAADYSLDLAKVTERVHRASVRGVTAKPVHGIEKAAAAPDPAASALARDYAVYKLAALARIAEFDPRFTLTAKLSGCQNYTVNPA